MLHHDDIPTREYEGRCPRCGWINTFVTFLLQSTVTIKCQTCHTSVTLPRKDTHVAP